MVLIKHVFAGRVNVLVVLTVLCFTPMWAWATTQLLKWVTRCTSGRAIMEPWMLTKKYRQQPAFINLD